MKTQGEDHPSISPEKRPWKKPTLTSTPDLILNKNTGLEVFFFFFFYFFFFLNKGSSTSTVSFRQYFENQLHAVLGEISYYENVFRAIFQNLNVNLNSTRQFFFKYIGVIWKSLFWNVNLSHREYL